MQIKKTLLPLTYRNTKNKLKLTAMKTNLDITIETKEDAKAFLIDLVNNGEEFHPEDEVFEMEWNPANEPTFEEKCKLNDLMVAVWQFQWDDAEDPNSIVMEALENL